MFRDIDDCAIDLDRQPAGVTLVIEWHPAQHRRTMLVVARHRLESIPLRRNRHPYLRDSDDLSNHRSLRILER